MARQLIRDGVELGGRVVTAPRGRATPEAGSRERGGGRLDGAQRVAGSTAGAEGGQSAEGSIQETDRRVPALL